MTTWTTKAQERHSVDVAVDGIHGGKYNGKASREVADLLVATGQALCVKAAWRLALLRVATWLVKLAGEL